MNSGTLLFGCDCERSSCKRCNPSEKESVIIFDADMSLDEKLQKLNLLRANNRPKVISFRKLITGSDHIHAHALGISLT